MVIVRRRTDALLDVLDHIVDRGVVVHTVIGNGSQGASANEPRASPGEVGAPRSYVPRAKGNGEHDSDRRRGKEFAAPATRPPPSKRRMPSDHPEQMRRGNRSRKR